MKYVLLYLSATCSMLSCGQETPHKMTHDTQHTPPDLELDTFMNDRSPSPRDASIENDKASRDLSLSSPVFTPDVSVVDGQSPPVHDAHTASFDGYLVDASVPPYDLGTQHTPDPHPHDCDDGIPCTLDVVNADGTCGTDGVPPGPCQWIGQWQLSAENPVLYPTRSDARQGLDNVYASDLLWHDGRWWMWYGAQGGDGRDAIFLAWSQDLVTWQKYPSWSSPQSVIDHGDANHVNDPSVVQVDGTFYLYYTEAATAEEDRIHLATSEDGINWRKRGEVLGVGAVDSWEADRVGRPSVLYESGEFRMWYDGQVFGVARHVGYATSSDGVTWTKHPSNPILLNEGAVDVERVGHQYVLLAEAHMGTKLYVAQSPLDWHFVGLVLERSGQAYDTYGQVTPHLAMRNGEPVAIFVGGASDTCWCKNRIAVAYMNADFPGCSACLAGAKSCQAACAGSGAIFGFCAAPDSQDPSACCQCCEDWLCTP